MHHLPHLPPSCPSRSSQGTELSSLRSIGTSPQLSILHLIVYICGCHFFHLFTSFLPLVSTNPFSSLCLHCLPAISSLIPFSRFHKCVNIQYWFSLSDFTLYNRTNIYWAFFFCQKCTWRRTRVKQKEIILELGEGCAEGLQRKTFPRSVCLRGHCVLSKTQGVIPRTKLLFKNQAWGKRLSVHAANPGGGSLTETSPSQRAGRDWSEMMRRLGGRWPAGRSVSVVDSVCTLGVLFHWSPLSTANRLVDLVGLNFYLWLEQKDSKMKLSKKTKPQQCCNLQLEFTPSHLSLHRSRGEVTPQHPSRGRRKDI